MYNLQGGQQMNHTIVFVSTSGASESPDSGECEETRRELLGGHAPPLGHCQGEQHEAAEAEKGGERTTWKYIFQLDGCTQIILFLSLIRLSGRADSASGNEAEDAKTRRRRTFETFVEH